jgi:BlaI family transcriptional regulator, penicillinase repressor
VRLPRRKNPDPPLTALELEIMKILWDTGPANVQTVQAKLEGGALAYTTVQTMLNVLHRKERIERQMKDRAYVYKPLLSRQTAASQAVREMVERFFGGSADNLVLNLVETRQVTPEKLAELTNLVEKEGANEPD